MAPLRNVDPMGLYHVMSRGNFRQVLFIDDAHYAKYVGLVGRVSRRRRWIVLDWCLMPNHIHLLLQLTDNGLSDGMRELNGGFSRWSNVRTGRTGTGHLFKNRFLSLDVVKEGHFWTVMQYIALNPVRAGLVDEPEDWTWSGYRATVGLEHPRAFHHPAELLRYFSADPAVAIERYVSHVQNGRALDPHGALGHDPWSDQGSEEAAA
jgi:REP-associated tyrosine transposase